MATTPSQLAGVQAGLGELRSRLLFVLIALLVYRVGTHIPVPGGRALYYVKHHS